VRSFSLIRNKKIVAIILGVITIFITLAILASFRLHNIRAIGADEPEILHQGEDEIDLSKINIDDSMPDCCHAK